MTVKHGETLSSIAARTLGDAQEWRRFLASNPGIDPDMLRVGQRLKVPSVPARPARASRAAASAAAGARTHRVAEGETLSSIAEAYYGHTQHWNRLFEANRATLKNDPDRLPLAVVLVVPE
ncbi:MAG: LysM peptidoglycan-binding domain-containing protein [Phycisphaerales bacterium]|nr:LysM peptidoglycan-binding domain-containing protein [Phycisphaerales bacterium]